MSKASRPRLSGLLMISAGLMFFLAAALAQQPAFAGVGVAFLGLGLANVRRASMSSRRQAP